MKNIIENNINHNKNQPITHFFNACPYTKNKILSYLQPSDALNCLKTSHLFARAIQTSHILYQNLSPQNLISFKNNQYNNHFQDTQKIPQISINITNTEDLNQFISILNDMNVRILHIDASFLNLDDFQNFLIQHKPISVSLPNLILAALLSRNNDLSSIKKLVHVSLNKESQLDPIIEKLKNNNLPHNTEIIQFEIKENLINEQLQWKFQELFNHSKSLKNVHFICNSPKKLEDFITYFSHIVPSATLTLQISEDQLSDFVTKSNQLPKNTIISEIDSAESFNQDNHDQFNTLLSRATNLKTFKIQAVNTEGLTIPSTIHTFMTDYIDAPLSFAGIKSISKIHISSIGGPISHLPKIINEFNCPLFCTHTLDLTTPKIISKIEIGDLSSKIKLKPSNLSYSNYIKLSYLKYLNTALNLAFSIFLANSLYRSTIFHYKYHAPFDYTILFLVILMAFLKILLSRLLWR